MYTHARTHRGHTDRIQQIHVQVAHAIWHDIYRFQKGEQRGARASTIVFIGGGEDEGRRRRLSAFLRKRAKLLPLLVVVVLLLLLPTAVTTVLYDGSSSGQQGGAPCLNSREPRIRRFPKIPEPLSWRCQSYASTAIFEAIYFVRIIRVRSFVIFSLSFSYFSIVYIYISPRLYYELVIYF